MKYIPLHVHSDYSMLQSTCSLKKLANKVKEYNLEAIGLTDISNMCGAVEFYLKMKQVGAKAIIGCHFYISLQDFNTKNFDTVKSYELVLLAKNNIGYQNLCKLSSLSNLEGFYQKPHIDKKILQEYSEGLIGICCYKGGEISHNVAINKEAVAHKTALFYQEVLEDFYIEVQRHNDNLSHPTSIINFANKYNLKLLATNQTYYIDQNDAESHHLLMCIKEKTTIIEKKQKYRFNSNTYYFKSPLEMQEAFSDIPEALENSYKIMEQCNVSFDFNTNHYPIYPLKDNNQDEYLRNLCIKNLAEKYNFIYQGQTDLSEREQMLLERLNFELEVIIRTGYSSYFLVVWDFILFARENGIPVGTGRGSGAGSIVAYLLDIVTLDPIEYNLLFERFLNPERVSPPDFDIDFCERRRHEVIQYVQQKYGAKQVAQIGTYGTLKAKAVIKDVNRALGYHHLDADRLTKTLSNNAKLTLSKALKAPTKDEPNELYSAEFANIVNNDHKAQEILVHAKLLEGLNRQMGVHAAGVIIGDQNLSNLIPLCKSQNIDIAVTQYAANPCEGLGLLKMDFLGLKTLTIINDACKSIATVNQNFDIENIPLDDPKTYKLFQKGQTVAIFQYESIGMQKSLRDLKPTVFNDMIAMNALYRPGPMDKIPSFVKRKNKTEKISYIIDDMKEYLQETYGITVYQEQVMLLSQKLASFTKGEADTLRKAMGKKKLDLLEQLKPQFIKQGCENGYDATLLEEIWLDWESFASYAFNKSHATCYAFIGYQTAYLKSHYPAHFMAAVMSADLNNSDRLTIELNECKKLNLTILPPDVNHSQLSFSIDENNQIRFGLSAIRGVGSSIAEKIISFRKKYDNFSSLLDFCEKVPVNQAALENLIKAGAFDFLGEKRSCLYAVIGQTIERAQSSALDKKIGQMSLFDSFSDDELNQSNLNVTLPNIDEWDKNTLLAQEKSLLGFYLSGHPLDSYQYLIDAFKLEELSHINDLEHESKIRLVLLIKSYNVRYSKKDNLPWATINFEDQYDNIEGLIFSKNFLLYKQFIHNLKPVIIEGTLKQENDTSTIFIDKLLPIEEGIFHLSSKLTLKIKEKDLNEKNIFELKELLNQYTNKVSDTNKTFLTKEISKKVTKQVQSFNDFSTICLSQLEQCTSIEQLNHTINNENFAHFLNDLTLADKQEILQKFHKKNMSCSLLIRVELTNKDLVFLENKFHNIKSLDSDFLNKIQQLFGKRCLIFKAEKIENNIRSFYKNNTLRT